MLALPGDDAWADRPTLFDAAPPGRVLLLDADGPAYRASATAKTLETAMRRFIQLVLTEQFLTNSETTRVYLTASGCVKAYRDAYPTILPYQGNRTGKSKPPLLEPLRLAIARLADEESSMIPDTVSVHLHHYWEADDAMIMDAYLLKKLGIIDSADKDLRMTPYPYWEQAYAKLDCIEDRFGWIGEAFTDAGKLKVVGHGTKFFLAQLLMGDKADNVKGLAKYIAPGARMGKLIGERGTLDVLSPITDENEAIDHILRAYARNGQNPLAEAECLWLRRHEEDSAFSYFMEADLDPVLRRWLVELHEYHQEVLAIEQERRREQRAV